MTLAPGTKLGPYEILAPIGAGGMGEVWKARDTRLGRIVAIKKVKEQHSERFKQEARSIASLNHPNICQLFDIGPDYLVLEYVEGKPLLGPMPEKEAVQLAIQITAALEEAHRNGIIHRDLKPSNIMVTGKGSVKLLDFGLAKLYEQDAGSAGVPPAISTSPTADYPATQVGAVIGTVAYMSPEQAQGRPADTRSDIFSFGLVLYEMLSGRRAFSGDSTPTVMAALLRDEPLPIQASPALEKVVRRCLAKQPSGRYQTISEAGAALERVFAEKATAGSSEPPSIAVLPFVNMSGDKEQEYFSDGLAEEIINVLVHIPGLRVAGRTSSFFFRGKDLEFAEIGKRLNVDHILEGSVRKAGNRIRVTAQLIKVTDGFHLWSERYDRDLTDIFAVQDEIATAIAGALKVELSAETRATRRHEPDPAAHEAYLKARHRFFRLRRDYIEQARKHLEQAILLDPNYALAHCGLADHYLLLAYGGTPAHEAMPLVREEARKALEIEPSLPEANAMLGIVASIYDYDWKEAERRFGLAMAREPVSPRVRQWYGHFYLAGIGRTEDAIEQFEQVLKEDPLNFMARITLSYTLMTLRRWEEAQAEARKALELEEDYPWAFNILALAFACQGKWEEALHTAEKASPMIPELIGILAGTLKRMGDVDRAEAFIQKLKAGQEYGSAIGLVQLYLVSGETEVAALWLEKAIQQRHPMAPFVSPLIRSSSRWPVLAKLMNLEP